MINTLLVASALLPAIVLCVYIYKKDRVEKEPVGLLIKLLLSGIPMCFVAVVLELFVGGFIDGIYSSYGTFSADGNLVLPDELNAGYNFFTYFIGVALVEEFVKFATLVIFTRKSREFNSLFDGIVYAVFVSLGFAAFENVLYVLENGFVNALLRAVLAVPGHMFFGVMMGYYYSIGHITKKAGELEREFKAQGLINPSAKEFSCRRYTFLSLAVPVIFHGIYDYCCTYGTLLALAVFIAFVVFMYVYCFGKIRKVSAKDGGDTDYAYFMVMHKYPGLAGLLHQRAYEQHESYSSGTK